MNYGYYLNSISHCEFILFLVLNPILIYKVLYKRFGSNLKMITLDCVVLMISFAKT